MREEKIHKLEVHVAGICFDNDKVLVLKRSASRSLYPNLWECGGGQVETGENFEEAVIRQLKEEAGVIIKPLIGLKSYEILVKDEQRKIPGVRFICKIIGYIDKNGPKISKEHTEWRWQPINKLDELEFIPKLKEDIKFAYSFLKKIE
jgi:8-oxo-dGTP diphosphatase